jgi:hypothetical protein
LKIPNSKILLLQRVINYLQLFIKGT